MEMTLDLNAPGMTALHQAGLAGLYMTLRVLAESNQSIAGLNWKLQSNRITLDWTDTEIESAFKDLINKSFWLDSDGFVRLTGLETSRPPNPDQKYLLYLSLLNSFLQLGRHRPTGTRTTLSYEIDEKPIYIADFAPIVKFRHQSAFTDFLDGSGCFRSSVDAAGWLYPGGCQRHVAYAETKLNEPLKLALTLLFAPVGVIYYLVRSRTKGRKIKLAMLFPEVKNLELYSEVRSAIANRSSLEMTASGGSDAVLRMLTTFEAVGTLDKFAPVANGSSVCRVITFGIVSWNEKQKSRTYTRTVASNQLPGIENYRKASAIFPNRLQRVRAKLDSKGKILESERYFVKPNCIRELIAENIAAGKVWYDDLCTFLSNEEVREEVRYERKELSHMVEQATYEQECEQLFISVCHDSWRRRLGRIGSRAISENANFKTLADKEAERLRTSFARCKNAESLRETVVDFWSRGGPNTALRGNSLEKLLPLFEERHWRKARDLALLALISYQPQSKEEEEALTTDYEEREEDYE